MENINPDQNCAFLSNLLLPGSSVLMYATHHYTLSANTSPVKIKLPTSDNIVQKTSNETVISVANCNCTTVLGQQ
jgi:hypothetical protein